MHSLSSDAVSNFSPEIEKFCYIEKDKKMRFNTFFLILLTFIESLKVVVIGMIATLMMSAKLVTPDLHEMKMY